jgi:hypothetical protein
MLARASREDKLIRRSRLRPGRAAPRPVESPVWRGERRDADPSQDTAMYTCQCGMVFEAAVSTGVDCPHCGDSQAW